MRLFKKRRFAYSIYLSAALLVLGLVTSLVRMPLANAAESSMSADELQELFSKAAADSTIDLPEGTYTVEDYIELPRADNVTINAEGATFNGWVVFLSAGNSGMTWNGGTFEGDGTQRLGFTLLHATDATFEGMQFNQAVAFGQHLFDLLGSTGITFDDITARGYGNSTDVADLSVGKKYKEAIQTDYAVDGASGSKASQERLLDYGGKLDGKASGDITITNSKFLPQFEQDTMTAWAQSPVGQHLYAKDAQNHGITFKGNTIDDPIPLNDFDDEKYSGALHFVSVSDLNILNNEFSSSVEQRRDWIQVVNNANTTNPGDGTGNLPTVGVTIAGNTFTEKAPTRAYVMLMADKKNTNFTMSDVEIADNTAATDGAEAKCVYIVDAASQIEAPIMQGNQGCA